MANISDNDRIDDVAPGDVVLVQRASDQPRPYKVVHKDADKDTSNYVITFEDDDGETFQIEYPAGTGITRSLEAKWESEQSPTQHKPI